VGGLGARVDAELAVHLSPVHGVDVGEAEAGVAALPGAAAVVAGVEAVAVGAGEDAAAGRLDGRR
jgi:hypothetical protein